MRLSDAALAVLEAAKARALEVGDVFLIPRGHAFYWDSPERRRALLVRVQRAANGVPAVAYLVYGTTKQVPRKRALRVPKGEAGLVEDTTFDFGPHKELTVPDLLNLCESLGRLDPKYDEEIERLFAASKLPFKNLPR